METALTGAGPGSWERKFSGVQGARLCREPLDLQVNTASLFTDEPARHEQGYWRKIQEKGSVCEV